MGLNRATNRPRLDASRGRRTRGKGPRARWGTPQKTWQKLLLI
jgi:hypothetical protein